MQVLNENMMPVGDVQEMESIGELNDKLDQLEAGQSAMVYESGKEPRLVRAKKTRNSSKVKNVYGSRKWKR